ncbi:TPR repeat-containing protein [Ilyonectria robusta]
MDVVYVRSTPARRQGLASESLSGGHHVPPAQRDDDDVQPGGEHSNFQHNHTAESLRQWSVTIAVNDRDAVQATITDPFAETEYEKIFEHYLRDSDRPRWSAESMSMTLQESAVDGVSHLEERIRWYGEHLLSQLKLSFSPDATECQIYIIESDPGPSCADWCDRHGNEVPWLLFAKQNHVPRTHGYQVPQTHLAKAADIAAVLARHDIENVVLNACLSAYNRTGSATSLAHIFLEHGICNVSAMWFFVHWQTVSTYLDTFYDELLYHCKPFHIAAQRGREAIRQKPTSRIGREYQDFFLCVNYSRRRPTAQVVSPIARDPSPAPSARSQGSTTSDTSAKSFMSGMWKPSTPRLADSFILGGEPVMRMQLHLLELEYKLMTFRVVYASDLRRPGSKLNSTIDQMVHMWLNTNLVDEVLYYKAKDFARSTLSRMFPGGVKHRERRTRATNGGYLQLLFPRPVRALRQTLHVVRDVDGVVAPGFLADAGRNAQLEHQRSMAQAGLRRFAAQLHEDGHSYLLFLGSEDAQWWRTYLQHLQGEWWVHLPWSYTVHSRYIRERDNISIIKIGGRRYKSSLNHLFKPRRIDFGVVA